MKVRWTSSSIRLRITPGELAALERGEPIAECLSLCGDTVWAVHVIPGPEAEATSLTSDHSAIRIRVTLTDIARLSSPENEGIYFSKPQPHPTAPPFRYFIEKDFPCIHPRPAGANEPEYETFTAPVGFAERHSRKVC